MTVEYIDSYPESGIRYAMFRRWGPETTQYCDVPTHPDPFYPSSWQVRSRGEAAKIARHVFDTAILNRTASSVAVLDSTTMKPYNVEGLRYSEWPSKYCRRPDSALEEES